MPDCLFTKIAIIFGNKILPLFHISNLRDSIFWPYHKSKCEKVKLNFSYIMCTEYCWRVAKKRLTILDNFGRVGKNDRTTLNINSISLSPSATHDTTCTNQIALFKWTIQLSGIICCMSWFSDEYHFASCKQRQFTWDIQQHLYDISARKWLLLVSCNDWFNKCVWHEINRFPLIRDDFFYRHSYVIRYS